VADSSAEPPNASLGQQRRGFHAVALANAVYCGLGGWRDAREGGCFMIVVDDDQIDVFFYPDHESRTLELILTGAAGVGETSGTAPKRLASHQASATPRHCDR